MMKKALVTLLVSMMLACFFSCDSANPVDHATELYGKTWETYCLAPSPGPGSSYKIEMTFSSGGSFQRIESYYSDAMCESAGILSDETVTINKTFNWIEETVGGKKLTYIDENDETVHVLYQLTDGVLNFAEGDSGDYPADLNNAIEFQ